FIMLEICGPKNRKPEKKNAGNTGISRVFSSVFLRFKSVAPEVFVLVKLLVLFYRLRLHANFQDFKFGSAVLLAPLRIISTIRVCISGNGAVFTVAFGNQPVG